MFVPCCTINVRSPGIAFVGTLTATEIRFSPTNALGLNRVGPMLRSFPVIDRTAPLAGRFGEYTPTKRSLWPAAIAFPEFTTTRSSGFDDGVRRRVMRNAGVPGVTGKLS